MDLRDEDEAGGLRVHSFRFHEPNQHSCNMYTLADSSVFLVRGYMETNSMVEKHKSITECTIV